MGNFHRNDNKLANSYLLTSSCIEAKTCLTVSFLKHKVAGYEAIRNEIKELGGTLRYESGNKPALVCRA